MNRRNVLKFFGLSGSTMIFNPFSLNLNVMNRAAEIDDSIPLFNLEKLKNEPSACAEIKTERGGPRLSLNGSDVYPLFALSTSMTKTTTAYKESGINFLAPLLGMSACWVGPEKYDWLLFDKLLSKLLYLNPDAYFILRLHLNTPKWWKDSHPDEIIKYGLPFEEKFFDMELPLGENGFPYGIGKDVYEVSWASEIWLADTGKMVQSFLEYINNSPLKSRVIGYQPTTGFTGEWGYFGPWYLPDYSNPMKKAVGDIPTPEARMNTTFGLLRDPDKEKDVIEFYRRFHDVCAEAILYFAKIVKEKTDRRVLCGAFYTYVLENVMMQEIGNLASEPILKSKDIDYIVSPYSYLHTNRSDRPRWTSDIYDDAENWLGRARGVGGDGADRILLESIKRHKKLYIVELDPSTYLEKKLYSEGGSGHETVEGTKRIIQRDMAKMFAAGYGGWFYDFGPTRGGTGLYTSQLIINEIKKFAQLGEQRKLQDISSVAEIAAVYDTKSFFVTQHWTKTAPYKGLGCYYVDFINHWFLACQLRTYSRIGAPMDYFFRSDLKKSDCKRYKLLFIPNSYYLTSDEVDQLREILKGSGTTVVWYYAPGFVTPEKLDLKQMERLTGFHFKILTEPGPMKIKSDIRNDKLFFQKNFGVIKNQFPRFVVDDKKADALGHWTDNGEIAFAKKEFDGWFSVYVGAAPLPVEIVRWLAQSSGAKLWSSKADVVYATKDAVALIATEMGERSVEFPKPLGELGDSNISDKHELNMEFGEVKTFFNPND